MKSRGSIYALGAGAKRGLVLLGTALLLSTMLLQYIVAASPALAVHEDGVFELDGNAVNGAAAGNDWDQVYAGTSGADATTFITDGVPERSFTGGGSKDISDTDAWEHTLTSVPDKDDLQHAFAALYGDVIYFGADRYSNDGDAAIGFWFFKNGISINANGTFSPVHALGDLLVVSHFVNGGSASEIELYEWVGGKAGLSLVASGQGCTAAPASDKACAIVNSAAAAAPWPYTPKTGPAGTFPAGAFFEGGLDLAQVYGAADVPCFSGFLVETRSSQEPNAQLKDFVGGSFNTCEPPTIATVSSASSVDFGGSVTDTATLSGTDGPASGTVTFFVCGPSASGACSSGGTQVGSPVAVTTSANGGTATSTAFQVGVTAAAAGTYCWRAEYTPDSASQYLAGSHTNLTTECFKVDEATIQITKTADAASVSAGDPIGFTVTVTNTGLGTARGVTVSDPLPTGTGVSWSETPDAAGWAISGGNLGFGPVDLAPGASSSVHISSPTTKDSCKTYTNTASVATTNDGSGDATASVVVNCPDITVVKTAVASPVSAGDPIAFDITVSNSNVTGTGTAYNVTLTDPLPNGITWSENSGACTITGTGDDQVLTCSWASLAKGASATVRISGTTSAADRCA